MTNAISAHKDELEKLIEDLSGDIAVSGITFVALVNAYIARLDANPSGISVNPPPGQIDGELTYGTNIDPKLRALLHAAQNFKKSYRTFQEVSRCGPKANAGCSPAADARRTYQASGSLPRQRPLSNVASAKTPRL